MDYNTRKPLYEEIEKLRDTKVLTYITGDRAGMETQISPEPINMFVEFLDHIGPTKRISLILYTNGGQSLVAWRLINLIRTFADEVEVIIPMKALSAGTLIAIGADKIVMTKQAALGPIDPSVNNPLNPLAELGGQKKQVPVSVEGVRGYLNAAREELGIKSEEALTNIFALLSQQIHPLVLGEVFRSQSQIRFLAEKLLPRQIKDKNKINDIIDFLVADNGSHDYTMNRREAEELGLNIEKPSVEFYQILRDVHDSYFGQLKILEPYSQHTILAGTAPDQSASYSEPRALVESVQGGSYAYLSEGKLQKVIVSNSTGQVEGIQDTRAFEGWRKIA